MPAGIFLSKVFSSCNPFVRRQDGGERKSPLLPLRAKIYSASQNSGIYLPGFF